MVTHYNLHGSPFHVQSYAAKAAGSIMAQETLTLRTPVCSAIGDTQAHRFFSRGARR